MGRALLMANEDVLDFGIEERVVGRQDRASGIAENYVNAFGDQGLDSDLSSGKFLHGLPFRRGLQVLVRRSHYECVNDCWR